MLKQRSTLSKQHSTLLPKKKKTMSNECVVKFRPFDKVERYWTCSICFDFVEKNRLNCWIRQCCFDIVSGVDEALGLTRAQRRDQTSCASWSSWERVCCWVWDLWLFWWYLCFPSVTWCFTVDYSCKQFLLLLLLLNACQCNCFPSRVSDKPCCNTCFCAPRTTGMFHARPLEI